MTLTIARIGEWTWDGNTERQPAAVSPRRALTAALAEITEELRDEREIDLFLDAGNGNSAALSDFADVVHGGRRMRPSHATAVEPSQLVVWAMSELGWTGVVVTAVSDRHSSPLLPVALTAPGLSRFRVVAELRADEASTAKEFSGSIVAALLVPGVPDDASKAACERFCSVRDLVTRSGQVGAS